MNFHSTYRPKLLVLCFSIAACLLCACGGEDTECRQDMHVYMGINLVCDSLPAYSLHGLGSDSLLVDSAKQANIKVPLRKDADLTEYVIEANGINDTLHIAYARTETFVSLACGCAVMATLNDATATPHMVDSVILVNQAVTTASETHIKIYLRKP